MGKDSLLYSQVFLETLRGSYRGKDSFLFQYASDLNYYKPKVDQLNRMWESLPENIKSCERFKNELRSIKNGQHRGAISELISVWLLNRYFKLVNSQVKLGNKTPDFLVRNDSHSYIFETYSLGKDWEEIKEENLKIKLMSEIDSVDQPYSIMIEGIPIEKKGGGFSGFKKKLSCFLGALDSNYSSDEVHCLELEGGSFNFSVLFLKDEKKVSLGWIGNVKNDNNVEKMKEKFIKKKEKYFYPHAQICVADSALSLSKDRIIRALVGDDAISFSKDSSVPTLSFNKQDSLWGIKNPDLAKNLHVQGVLFVAKRHQHNSEMELVIYLAENYHLMSGLSENLNDVPNVFAEHENYQPLIIKP